MPDSTTDPEDLFARVLDEFTDRLQRGESPTVEEYADRYPALAADLRAVLPLLPAIRPPAAGGQTTVAQPGRPPADPARPLLGGFHVLHELGRGGMGVVYLATQTSLNRPVALKMVLSGAHATPAERARFLAEAEVLARFQHPHIVQVHEFGTDPAGHPFFALEYLAGGSLAAKLQAGPLTARAAAELIQALARAVGYAHARGVIHRDLKPANVLFAADGTPKVTDFGLAKQTDAGAGLTATDAVVGTPSYMAPEQAAGSKAVGPPADGYALGAVLYECLTGRPPFRGSSVYDTLSQVRTREPISVRALQPSVPKDLETVCLKCLEKDPTRRYPTAEALADDLGRFLDGRPVVARPVSSAVRLARAARRHPAWAALAGVVTAAVVLLSVAAVYLYRAREAAEVSEGRAVTERDRARQNLQVARETLDATGTRLIDNIKLKQADFADLRKELLAALAPLYRRLAAEPADTPALEADRGRVLSRLALLESHLGDEKAALAAHQEAVAIFRRLRAATPDDAQARHDLAHALRETVNYHLPLGDERAAEAALAESMGLLDGLPADPAVRRNRASALAALGGLRYSQNRFTEAADHLGGAAAEYAAIAAADPDNPTVRLEWGKVVGNHALALINGNQLAAAEPRLREALAVLAPLFWTGPDRAAVRAAHAQTLGYLANTLEDLGRLDDSARVNRAAADLLESLVKDFGSVTDYRQTLAMTQNNLGIVLKKQGNYEEAAAACRRAVEQHDLLHARYPDVVVHRLFAGSGRHNLGQVLRLQGRSADALPEYARGLELVQVVFDKAPGLGPTRMYLRDLYDGRARALLDLGRNAEAASDWEEAIRLDDPARPRPTYRINLAIVLARDGQTARAVATVADVEKMPGLGPADWFDLGRVRATCAAKDPARKAEHGAEAVLLLGKARAQGYFDGPARVAGLDTIPDLTAVRDRTDFKRLAAEVRAKAK